MNKKTRRDLFLCLWRKIFSPLISAYIFNGHATIVQIIYWSQVTAFISHDVNRINFWGTEASDEWNKVLATFSF